MNVDQSESRLELRRDKGMEFRIRATVAEKH